MSTDTTKEQPSASPFSFGKKSTTPSALAAALAKFQGAVGAIHKSKTAKIDSRDPNKKGFVYKYADLASIAEAAYPLLAENGLSFTASPTMGELGFVLEYALLHESGESQRGTWPLPDPLKVDIKQIGIAITYARRYCFSAVTGIVTEEDTDTQGAPAPQQEQVGRPRPRKQDVPNYGPDDPRTNQQSNKIFAMLGELGMEYKSEEGKAEVLALFGGWLDKQLESTKDLTIREANKVIDNLQIIIDTEPKVDHNTGEVER